MTGTRDARHARTVFGPERVHDEHVAELNQLFSDAFTARYRKDGMVGVRVPPLNPAIWRYAIADADDGAMLWRGDRQQIVAFNLAHCSGREGWMGPLAVHSEWQGRSVGKAVVRAGIDWLQQCGASVIGLETMPRTMDNIGFYSSLGFLPQRLTITLTLEASTPDDGGALLGRAHAAAHDDLVEECRRLTAQCVPGTDFTREIQLTASFGLGDTAMLREDGALIGFAVFHTAPLVEGRARDELRVLKMVLRQEGDVVAMAALLQRVARRTGTHRVAMRMQGEYTTAYRLLMERGARVRWTDLRMVLPRGGEGEVRGLVLSNWEI